MNILYLGKADPVILCELMQDDVTIIACELVEGYDYGSPDWIVCNGYRHIIKEPFLTDWYGRIVNIHISLLPWNRGASPNLWSWYENTPKGVSIHQIRGGVDTGPIYCQRRVDLHPDLTLKSAYDVLQEMAAELFVSQWKYIADGAAPEPQYGIGSFHTVKQSIELMKQFKLGYRTKCSEVEEAGRKAREAIASVSTRGGGQVVGEKQGEGAEQRPCLIDDGGFGAGTKTGT